MAADDDQPSSGFSRRDALRLLAASTTTVAAGSLIISQPAFADNGSVACGYEFNNTPTMTVKLKNQKDDKKDSLSISVGNTAGSCKCNGKASLQYAYYVEIPGLGSGGTGWITSKDASVSSPSVLWGNSGGSVKVSVGVQVTCPGTPPVVQCWFGTANIPVGASNWNSSPSFQLTVNNSSNNPSGIPTCEPSAFRSSRLATSDSINLTAGLLAATDAAIGDDQTVDPALIEPGTTAPSTTTTTTSTTTPSTRTSTTTSTTSTSTTTSTTSTTAPSTTSTTTPSTTAPSTTAPPSPPGG